MELDFVNGNDVQKAACRTVAHNLLNLPFDSIPITHRVEFTEDPLPSSHNEFAVTEWAYDDLESLTKIASIAPAWPEPWRGMKFLQETYAHELGHALFAALPELARIEIVEMFGANSDALSELQPDGSAWSDRIIEGLAETFKDAFVPRGLRRYANRTNKHIPIHKYPQFRRLWRGATESIPSTGGETTEILAELDINELKQPNFFWLYQAALGKFGEGGSKVVEVPEKHTFNFSMTIPRDWFNEVAVNGDADDFHFAFRAMDAETEEVYAFHRGVWFLRDEDLAEYASNWIVPEWKDSGFFFEGVPEANEALVQGEDVSEGGTNHWLLFGEDAVALGPPPFTMNVSFSVPAGRTVIFQAMAFVQSMPVLSEVFEGDFQEEVRDALPNLPYVIGAVPGGQPIKLPRSTVSPGPKSSGRRRKDDGIVGRSR